MADILLCKKESAGRDAYRLEFESAGYSVHFINVLSHEFVNEGELSRVVQQRHQGVIVTSPRAVDALCMVTLSDEFKESPFYTVGEATGERLKQLGIGVVRGMESGTGEALAELIIEHYPLHKFIFLSGSERRDVLPLRLYQAGVAMQELVVYTTSQRESKVEMEQALAQGSAKWIVYFSPSGIDTASFDRVRKSNVKIATIGPTTRDFLLVHGITPNVVSPKPNAKSLAQAIKEQDSADT